MRLISHRGNLNGPNESCENDPKYIDEAIDLGFDVEIDIWLVDNKYIFLGHDAPKYPVPYMWLEQREKSLWMHCKNADSFEFLHRLEYVQHNYFWHQTDQYTLTSRGYIWAYPTAVPIAGAIIAIPESAYGREWIQKMLEKGFIGGICSDYISQYRVS